jgi:hypothetical protein
MNETFLRLIASLATCGPSNEPGTNDHRRWTETLKAIYRLNHAPAHCFLASINVAGIPNEAPDSLLLRSHQMAKAPLPELLRDVKTKRPQLPKLNIKRLCARKAASTRFSKT